MNVNGATNALSNEMDLLLAEIFIFAAVTLYLDKYWFFTTKQIWI